MAFLQPIAYAFAEHSGKDKHLIRLLCRNSTRTFIIANVTFLAEGVEPGNQVRTRPNRIAKRLYESVMVAVSCGTVARGAQGRRGASQGRILGHRQSPVRAQAGGLAFPQVSVGYAQERDDLLGAGLMRDEPAVSQPISQPHSRPRLDIFWAL